MIYPILGALLIVLSSAIYGPPLLRAARAYFHLVAGQKRLCPETGRPARVRINAARAARTILTSGLADLQVKNCTRWPERRGCGQECIAGADETGAPEDPENGRARLAGA